MNTKTRQLIDWYEHLTVESLTQIDNFYTDSSFFKDPFNEVRNIEKIRKIFQHMFETTKNPKFKFIDVIEGDQQSFVTWDFSFSKNDKNYNIHGSSHLKWSKDGKVNFHRDYWDVGEELLAKIPLISTIYNLLIKPLKLKD